MSVETLELKKYQKYGDCFCTHFDHQTYGMFGGFFKFSDFYFCTFFKKHVICTPGYVYKSLPQVIKITQIKTYAYSSTCVNFTSHHTPSDIGGRRTSFIFMI